MRIDEYVIIGLASEAKYGCNDICINLTKSDIKAVSGYNSVRVTLADALMLPLSFLLPAPPYTAWSCDNYWKCHWSESFMHNTTKRTLWILEALNFDLSIILRPSSKVIFAYS